MTAVVVRHAFLLQVFAEYEPNMPRVAPSGNQEPDRKSNVVRSASAVSITTGRAKVIARSDDDHDDCCHRLLRDQPWPEGQQKIRTTTTVGATANSP